MKQTSLHLSQRYVARLVNYVRRAVPVGLSDALALGRRAVSLGLETLDLAGMHEQAMLKLKSTGLTPVKIRRARVFFIEAITPIVETHRAARESQLTLNRLNEMLLHCTHELATAKRRLKQGVGRRQKMEAALEKAGTGHAKLLRESRQLQEGLRRLTHQLLVTQEEEREKISHELQDEIAQTLLGINVRLVSLKQESKNNSKGLKGEIISTQRLVARSVKSVRMVATRLGKS
jgi:signal transduction histidine kinase